MGEVYSTYLAMKTMPTKSTLDQRIKELTAKKAKIEQRDALRKQIAKAKEDLKKLK
jgi:hypothetical protein